MLSKVNSHKLNGSLIPERLRLIHSPPRQLYTVGAPLEELLSRSVVGIVGSRKISLYGRTVTLEIAKELARLGAVIISGLAFGVDAAAHQATIESGGQSIAVLPSSLENIYPAAHRNLAERIVQTGGTLVSEYSSGSEVFKTNFIERNRLISGLCDGLIITEAAKNSGSLHTAGFALEQGKTVMAVPGNINSPTSEGANNLIKNGALPITDIKDIVFALGLKPSEKLQLKIFRGTPNEQKIFDLINEGICGLDELVEASQLDGPVLSSVLTMLEVNGYIRAQSGQWTVI